MAKLVDALDLGSSGETHQSSSLCMPTIFNIFCAYNNFAIWRLRSGTTLVLDKLVDALDLGATGKPIRVRRPVCPPSSTFFARITILPYGVCVAEIKKPTLCRFLLF